MPALARRAGFLDSDGERLYFECVGDGDPLVLCHGAGGNHAIWWQQVPVFARRLRVVTWDQRGFGRSSDRARESGPAAAVRDLRALLAHLGIERMHLVGQSMGGWTALGFALAAPERVRSLVLADTLGGISTPEVDRHQRELLARAGSNPLAAAAELGRHPALDDAFAERDPALAYLYQMVGAFGEPHLARITQRLFTTRHAVEDVRRLDVPLLFVVGERDRLFPPPLVRSVAELLPAARVLEIPRCGHSPYFEDAAAWNAAVGKFLTDEGAVAPARG
jgi:2-succinyl-6-hydroxy-2,4-cyclohexadiene-1-carboxylate synthase